MPLESVRRTANASARSSLALPGLEPAVGLVDDVDAAAPSHDLRVLVALLQRLQRANDLHPVHPGPEAPASTCALRSLSTCSPPQERFIRPKRSWALPCKAAQDLSAIRQNTGRGLLFPGGFQADGQASPKSPSEKSVPGWRFRPRTSSTGKSPQSAAAFLMRRWTQLVAGM